MRQSGCGSSGVELMLSRTALVGSSITLLIFTGQTTHAFSLDLGTPSLIPPVPRLPINSYQGRAPDTVRVAFWPLVLNLLTGIFSLSSMLAAMFFRECGSSRKRSRFQYRLKGFYVSDMVLVCNALLATTAFLSTTILHSVVQSKTATGYDISGSDTPLMDVETWGCNAIVWDSFDTCTSSGPMRITLIPQSIAAWLVAFCVARFLRKEERVDAMTEDLDIEDIQLQTKPNGVAGGGA